MSSAKGRLFSLGLNELIFIYESTFTFSGQPFVYWVISEEKT